MSEEENKRIVRRLVEEFQSGHKFEVGEELTADDFIDRTPGPGESGNKKDGLEFFKYIWEAFPDPLPLGWPSRSQRSMAR